MYLNFAISLPQSVWSCQYKFSKEIIAFRGNVDIRLIEDVFLVPAIKLDGTDDTEGLSKLVEAINGLPSQGTVRILVAGYKKDMVPDKAGVLHDVITNPEEASRWVKNHHYDMAIVNREIRGAALLEFDLKERGIKVQG